MSEHRASESRATSDRSASGERLRVLHVINNLAMGGAEAMLVRLALNLRPHFDQSVVCLLDEGVLAPKLRNSGIPVLSLKSSPQLPSPWLPFQLARVMRNVKANVVQTWLYQSDLVGALAARLAGQGALVWNLRAAEGTLSYGHPVTRMVVRACAAMSRTMPTRIVCCAHSAAAYHREAGYDASRFVVIENGVDVDRFQPDIEARQSVRAELGLRHDTPLVGLIARLHPQKDHATFFEAARLIATARPDAHFLLAGQRVRADDPEMRRVLCNPALEGRVHLLGERHDVPRLTAALDVATSTSAWGEGFPNTLCEAMACGIPCVTTDSGDAARIVGDIGHVVPKRDPGATSEACKAQLALDPAARRVISRRARAHVMQHYDQRASIDRYAALYRSLGGASR